MSGPKLDSERALRKKHQIHTALWRTGVPLEVNSREWKPRRVRIRDVLAQGEFKWRTLYRYIEVLESDKLVAREREGVYIVSAPSKVRDIQIVDNPRIWDAFSAIWHSSKETPHFGVRFCRTYRKPLLEAGFTPSTVGHYGNHLERLSLMRHVPPAIILYSAMPEWNRLAVGSYRVAEILKTYGIRDYNDWDGYKDRLVVVEPRKIIASAGVRGSEITRHLNLLIDRGVACRVPHTGGFLLTKPHTNGNSR